MSSEAPSARRVVLVAERSARAERWAEAIDEAGIAVEWHETGATALESMRTRRPHAMVFDFWAPEIDGRTLVHRARVLHRKSVGLVAASEATEVGDWCRRVGGVRFVPVDASVDALLDAILSAIDESGAPAIDSPTSRKLRLARSVLLIGAPTWTQQARETLSRALPGLHLASLSTVADAARALETIAFDAVVSAPMMASTASDADLTTLCAARAIPWLRVPAARPYETEPETEAWTRDLGAALERALATD
jgi:CheY-like chemotaxis protein